MNDSFIPKKSAGTNRGLCRSTNVIFNDCTYGVLRRFLVLAENASLSTVCKKGRIKGVPLYSLGLTLYGDKCLKPEVEVLNRILDWPRVQIVHVNHCSRGVLEYVTTNAVNLLHLVIRYGLYVSPRHVIGEEMVRLTRKLIHVRSFTVSHAMFVRKDVHALASWKNLLKLDLGIPILTAADLVALSGCPMIEDASLKLNDCCDGSGLLALATGCKSLHTLTLYFSRKMFQTVHVDRLRPGVFGACQKLNLSISAGDNNSPRTLVVFFTMFNTIEYLRLKIDVIKHDNVGEMVSQCPRLKELRLFCYKLLVSCEDLTKVTLSELRLLHVYWCQSGPSGTYRHSRTDGLLALLNKNRNTLQILSLRGFDLGDKGLSNIAATVTQLRKLTVVEPDESTSQRTCRLTDTGLIAINIETLEEFVYACNLNRTLFTSVGVESLAHLAFDHHLSNVSFGHIRHDDCSYGWGRLPRNPGMYIDSEDEDEANPFTRDYDDFRRKVQPAFKQFPHTCVVQCNYFSDTVHFLQ